MIDHKENLGNALLVKNEAGVKTDSLATTNKTNFAKIAAGNSPNHTNKIGNDSCILFNRLLLEKIALEFVREGKFCPPKTLIPSSKTHLWQKRQ
jgi:hypothetical protein